MPSPLPVCPVQLNSVDSSSPPSRERPPPTLQVVVAKQDRTYAEALGWICAQVFPTAEVRTFGEGTEMLAALQASPVDFLLLGLTFRDADGMDLLLQISQHRLAKYLLVVAEIRDELLIPALQTARVNAILDTGSETLDAVREALHEVSAGKVYVSPALHPLLIDRGPAQPSRPMLTPAELRVLRVIGLGNDNQEAAAILELSEATVQTHRRNIMHKLKVPSSAKLVREAVRLGFVRIA